MPTHTCAALCRHADWQPFQQLDFGVGLQRYWLSLGRDFRKRNEPGVLWGRSVLSANPH